MPVRGCVGSKVVRTGIGGIGEKAMRWLLRVTFMDGRVVLVRLKMMTMMMRRSEFDLMITFGMNIDGIDLDEEEEETNDLLLAGRGER